MQRFLCRNSSDLRRLPVKSLDSLASVKILPIAPSSFNPVQHQRNSFSHPQRRIVGRIRISPGIWIAFAVVAGVIMGLLFFAI
jgi:hypothetical protein